MTVIATRGSVGFEGERNINVEAQASRNLFKPIASNFTATSSDVAARATHLLIRPEPAYLFAATLLGLLRLNAALL